MAEPWADTTTPAGRMILTVFTVFTVFTGIADLEQSLIVERTSQGRQAAKARGVRLGPKPALTSSQVAHARELCDAGKPIAEVAKLFGGHRSTIYRAIEAEQSA